MLILRCTVSNFRSAHLFFSVPVVFKSRSGELCVTDFDSQIANKLRHSTDYSSTKCKYVFIFWSKLTLNGKECSGRPFIDRVNSEVRSLCDQRARKVVRHVALFHKCGLTKRLKVIPALDSVAKRLLWNAVILLELVEGFNSRPWALLRAESCNKVLMRYFFSLISTLSDICRYFKTVGFLHLHPAHVFFTVSVLCCIASNDIKPKPTFEISKRKCLAL